MDPSVNDGQWFCPDPSDGLRCQGWRKPGSVGRADRFLRLAAKTTVSSDGKTIVLEAPVGVTPVGMRYCEQGYPAVRGTQRGRSTGNAVPR